MAQEELQRALQELYLGSGGVEMSRALRGTVEGSGGAIDGF